MRITFQTFFWGGNAYQAEQFLRIFLFCFLRHVVHLSWIPPAGFPWSVPDSESSWDPGRSCQSLCPEMPVILFIKIQYVLPLYRISPPVICPGSFKMPHKRTACHTFAASALANQTKGFSAFNLEADIIYRLYRLSSVTNLYEDV